MHVNAYCLGFKAAPGIVEFMVFACRLNSIVFQSLSAGYFGKIIL